MYMRQQCICLAICMLAISASRRNGTEDNPQADETARLAWFQIEPWLISPPEFPEPSLPPPVGEPTWRTPYPPSQQMATPFPLPQPPIPSFPVDHQTITHIAPLVDDIRCSNSQGKQVLTATITLPKGFSVSPVLNDIPNINPLESQHCNVKRSTRNTNSYYLRITDFQKCGVFLHSENSGNSWLSLTLRFPYVEGFRLAEDKYAKLVCRPQDRRAFREHILEFQGKLPHLSKTIFRNAPQDFYCKMALFAKSSEGRFQRHISSGSAVIVGEEVQLRATVRPGDGWKYAAMSDVVVQRIKSQMPSKYLKTQSHISPRNIANRAITEDESNSIKKHDDNMPYPFSAHTDDFPIDKAHLVFDNGCRNPKFRAVAANHPYADSQSLLTVNFNFRTFMFQDMEDGDSLRISAKIIACANAADCHLNLCVKNADSHGRHRRSPQLEDSLSQHDNKSSTIRNLDVIVRLPGYVAAAMTKPHSEEMEDGDDIEEGPSCRTFAISLSVVCLFFCLAVTGAAAFAVRFARKHA